MAITRRPEPSLLPSSRPRAGALACAGSAVLAVAVALGVGETVAALVSPASAPFTAVGQGAIRLTPEWLKELAIAWFATYDKVALISGMSLVLVALAVVAGLASRRDERPGAVVVATMGVLGIAAVVTAPTFGVADLLAPAAALGAGVFAWRRLHERALALAAARVEPRTDGPRTEAPTTTGGAPEARRRFVLGAGIAAGVAAVTGAAGRLFADGGEDPGAVGPLPPARAASGLDTAGADFTADGTPPWTTPASDFYRIDTALAVPRLSTADWRLRIHGMVDREITLTYDQLRARRLIEAPVTLSCVSNEVGGTLVSNGVWTGVPVGDLLAEAGVAPDADQIASTSSDGWNCNTPLGPLTDGRPAMLAIGLNGAALPVEHGFPVRMVVPGLYGYVSACKWITDIEVTTFAGFTSYWEERGWSRLGPVKTESRIDVPRRGARVPAGRTVVAGVAWAQHTGIGAVEVWVDGGPWQPAGLAAEPSVDSWRMWRLPVGLVPGTHELTVRATDRSGYTQTAQEVPTIPDGATGWHTVEVTVV